MRIVSEQANAKLQIIPTDINSLTDEELMGYIIELRGNRGKSTERKAREPGAPRTKTPKAAAVTTVADMNLDDLA